jgi:DNA adenine methylase
MTDLKSPFPYFGGKSKVADEVWRRFGDVQNYIEPFCGSCAVLLARPNVKGSEIVNDLNGLLVNFWRAVKHEPDRVAEYAESPPSTIDLRAKHNYVYQKRSELAEKMADDPEYYNAKIAGYWVYAQSVMVGGRGIFQENIDYRKPYCGSGGRGIQSHSIGSFRDYARMLADRLENVSILCGEWGKCLSKSCTIQDASNPRTSAIFLDPPYQIEDYYSENYEHSNDVFWDVLKWCRDNQKNEHFRIALCGYTNSGVSSLIPDWTKWVWSRHGGYANRGDKKENKHRECIWFSPSCRLTGEQERLV